MEQKMIDQIVDYLDAAEQAHEEVIRVTEEFQVELTEETAYAVQDALLRKKQARGETIFAPKLGLTSPSKMKQMGVDSPIHGFVFDCMVDENHASIDSARFIHPKAEPEIAVVLKEDIFQESISYEEVVEKIDYVVSSVEIIDSRYKDFKFTLPDVIADNTSASGALFGSKQVKLSDINLLTEGATIAINGKALESGVGANVYDDPIKTLIYLTESLYKRGLTIPKGVPIMTGALTAAFAFEAGDTVTVTYDTLDTIEFTVR